LLKYKKLQKVIDGISVYVYN